jgi:hypothetical protein
MAAMLTSVPDPTMDVPPDNRLLFPAERVGQEVQEDDNIGRKQSHVPDLDLAFKSYRKR